jgi:HK97 family phage major capsid protein
MTQGGVLALTVPKITRREALTVPAVLRARNLICATLGGLPVRLHGPNRVIRPSRLLEQPELDVPRSVTMTRLVEDLLLDGIGWWRVKLLGVDNFPAVVERIDPGSVHVDPDGRVYVNGLLVGDSELIRFDSPNPALLEAGARAIRTLLKLDAAAARYADEPIPPGYLTPRDGASASEEEAEAALDKWAASRGTRGTAYVGEALEFKTLAMNAEQIQLAESRQHAVLEIARATGLDAEDLGVSTTSRTYQNAESRRLDLLDFTLGHYVSAIQDRLSMGDVTPRGSYVKVAFEGFLRSDALTRMQVYRAGLEVGAFAPDEIRGLEDKPALSAAQRKALTPAPVPVQQQSADPVGVTSFTAAGDVVTLAFAPSDVEQFRADPEKRTVAGMLLPFNVQTSDGRRIRFAAGSVTWQRAAVSRIKLDREHDLGQLLGSATQVSSNDAGVRASFKVARTPAGDEALALAADGALDGLSAVVRITDAIPDPAGDGGTLVTAAQLVRATLTADPAFDDARLSAVALSSEGNTAMQCTVCGTVHAAGTPCATPPAPDFAPFTAAVEAFTGAVTSLGQTRDVIPAGRAVVTREEPVYQYGAAGMRGASFVRDAFTARVEGDTEAAARLQKWQRQLADEAAQFRVRSSDEQFATVNRTVGANVIPPGYRPDLYQPQLFQDRPLYGMVSQGTLTDATPFTLPTFTSATGASADHVEGTNPTDGTLVIGTRTVTPGAISGLFKITREVIDAANPAIDSIALAAMRESYSQQTEGKVYTELNGTNGVGGVITSGFVPSGAAAIAVTGVGSTGAAGATLLDTIRDQVVAYPFRRFAAPNRLALSQEAAGQFAKAKDSTGRPLLPRLGAQNSVGTVSTLGQAFDVDGLPGVPAWSMTGNAAGDADTILWNAADVWAWESDLLTFRYEERSGPALVELALFGYFAVRILRPLGFSGIRLTVT